MGLDMRNIDTDKNQQQALQFSMTENAEYHEAQNQEINWLKMEQIRMGLKDKVDATVYANPAYSYETMRQIRLSLYSAISKLNGKFEYINGRMIISNMLVVHEDVTSVTGKLEVDGSVILKNC